MKKILVLVLVLVMLMCVGCGKSDSTGEYGVNKSYAKKYEKIEEKWNHEYVLIGELDKSGKATILEGYALTSDGVTVEDYIKNTYEDTLKLFEKEVLSYVDEGDFKVVSDEVVVITDGVYQVVTLKDKKTGNAKFKFAVDPVYKNIWKQNLAQGTYSLWDGTFTEDVLAEQ